jgi:hypothetical protein
MFHFSPRVFVQSTIAGACLLAASCQVQAQQLLANPSITNNHGNTSSAREVVPSKRISGSVRDGVLTIDGMIAKMQLNYSMENTSYMYFFVPGVGTAVLSLSPLPDSVKVKNAFDGSSMSFTVNGHSFELSSQGDIFGGGKTDAYVHLDGATVALARTPRMGFGTTLQPPYVWPLSQLPNDDKHAGLVAPPALPANLVARTAPDEATAAPSVSVATVQPKSGKARKKQTASAQTPAAPQDAPQP